MMYSFFILFTFIIVVIAILMSNSLVTTMALVSIMANLLVIATRFGKISERLAGASESKTDATGVAGAAEMDSAMPPGPATDSEIAAGFPDIPQYRFSYDVDPDDYHVAPYGPFYENWRAYKTSYSTAYETPEPYIHVSCGERNYSVDSANTLMAQRRFHDKKAMDGYTVKDANYYRYHFSNELDEEEAKPWWGRHEM